MNTMVNAQDLSQSPDEDSLSSDSSNVCQMCLPREIRLNPLTRIHCLPTKDSIHRHQARRQALGLNPLTRIHCLPTIAYRPPRPRHRKWSQSPDEDSLSSDPIARRITPAPRTSRSQSPDEDSLSSDGERAMFHQIAGDAASLNPLTRIHCLPTVDEELKLFAKMADFVSIP